MGLRASWDAVARELNSRRGAAVREQEEELGQLAEDVEDLRTRYSEAEIDLLYFKSIRNQISELAEVGGPFSQSRQAPEGPIQEQTFLDVIGWFESRWAKMVGWRVVPSSSANYPAALLLDRWSALVERGEEELAQHARRKPALISLDSTWSEACEVADARVRKAVSMRDEVARQLGFLEVRLFAVQRLTPHFKKNYYAPYWDEIDHDFTEYDFSDDLPRSVIQTSEHIPAKAEASSDVNICVSDTAKYHLRNIINATDMFRRVERYKDLTLAACGDGGKSPSEILGIQNVQPESIGRTVRNFIKEYRGWSRWPTELRGLRATAEVAKEVLREIEEQENGKSKGDS